MTKNVTIAPLGDKIVVEIGGRIRTLDFRDGLASISVYEKDAERSLLNIIFTDEVPIPKPEGSSLELNVAVPRKEEAGE